MRTAVAGRAAPLISKNALDAARTLKSSSNAAKDRARGVSRAAGFPQASLRLRRLKFLNWYLPSEASVKRSSM